MTRTRLFWSDFNSEETILKEHSFDLHLLFNIPFEKNYFLFGQNDLSLFENINKVLSVFH